MKKRVLSLLLSFSMVFGMLPAARAAEGEEMEKLGTPVPYWGENHATCWTVTEPSQNYFQFKLYKDGEPTPVKTMTQFRGSKPLETVTNHYFEVEDYESGTYYFTVQSLSDGTQYANSEIATSEEFIYEKPAKSLAPATDLEWNWPNCRWTDPADSDFVYFYLARIFYAAERDETPTVVKAGSMLLSV